MELIAAKGVSSLVKFSEVFLWDDVMDGNAKAAYRQNKKKYFLSDEDEDAVDKEGGKTSEVDSMENGCEIAMEDAVYRPNKKKYFHTDDEDGDAVVEEGGLEIGCGVAMEEVELSQQMSMMGLPLSFNSSKKNTNGSHQGSRKSTHLKFSQSYRNYADAAAVAGSFRVSAVNTSDPKSTYLELKELVELTHTVTSKDTKRMLCKRQGDYLTDGHPMLTECSAKNKKQTASNDFGIDPATVLSYPAELDALMIDDKKELDEDKVHEYVEDPSTDDRPGEVHQFSNGVEKIMLASNLSSDALDDSEWYDSNCYGEFEDWRIYWDNDYQQYYYFNISTTESTWEPPPGMDLQLPDDMVLSGEYAADDCISSIDGKPMDEDKPLDNCTSSFDDAAYCVTCDRKSISRLPLANEMNMDDFDINQCPDCHTLLGEPLENFSEASTAKRNRKSRKSRACKASSGIVKGDLTKYWCQRYYLFSRFDDGIKMDKEGWYSVTPEKIAEHHTSRCGPGIILDLFTGVGGNAIQFAQRSELVVAIDIDPRKIAYAQHNAAIYGVNNWIDFIQGDSFAIAPMLKADTVFLSPPWGGPEYAKSEVYDLKTMLKPYDGYYLFNSVKHIAPHIVMFLPRNVDVGQLVELAVSSTPPWSLEVEKNFLNGKLKAVTAYFRATETADINYKDQECQTV